MTDAEITPREIRTREAEGASRQGDWTAPGVTPAEPAMPSVLDRVVPLVGATPWQTLGWVAAFVGRRWRCASCASTAGHSMRTRRRGPMTPGSSSGASRRSPASRSRTLERCSFSWKGSASSSSGRATSSRASFPRWPGWPSSPCRWRCAGGSAVRPRSAWPRWRPSHRRWSTPRVSSRPRSSSPRWRWRRSPASFASAKPVSCAAPAARRLRSASPPGPPTPPEPSAISVMVSVIVGIAIAALSVPDGTMRRGLGALRRELPAFLLAAVATAILCFTRFLSYPPGIAGVGETLGAWWRLLTESSGQPAALFLMALLVYEPIAVVFAVAAVVRGRGDRGDALALFAGWSVAAFAIWSFSAGRGAEHAVHVALPLVLLGGHRPRQHPARDRLARRLARQRGAAGPAHARHRGRAGGGRRAPHPGRRPGRRTRGRAAPGRRALPGGRAAGLSGLAHDRRRAGRQAPRGNRS